MLTLILFLSTILTTTAAGNPSLYNNTDQLLINCGSDSGEGSDGRTWNSDAQYKLSPANTQSISSESKASGQPSSVPQVPYLTARIFQHSPFTYTFSISAGQKFLRLYFYPATYSGLQKQDSFFSVTAGDYTLLKNFSAYLTVESGENNEEFVIKEYVIQVLENQLLNITFLPSPESYAFINGIEVVPIPSNYYIRGLDYRITSVDQPGSQFYIETTSTALEGLYRLNVGANTVNPTGDNGMFRSWVQDDSYLFAGNQGFVVRNMEDPIEYTSDAPNYSAPEIVYGTARTMDNNSALYNMTWIFPVDSGFRYLLRLYFCEFQREVKLMNNRVFTIDINNKTADKEVDIILWTGYKIPVFKDYVVFMSHESKNRPAKRDLWLSMHPNMDSKPVYENAILNGLEIFKLSGSDRSLAGPNPERLIVPPPPPASVDKRNGKDSSMFRVIVGGVVGGILAVVLILGLLIFRRRKRSKQDGNSVNKSTYDPITTESGSTKTNTNGSTLPSGLCQRFSLSEIKSATNDFDENFVIGTGGFGKVYKGKVNNGSILVAIKRLNETSSQGVREFETEIELLSKLRHIHLVSLIGYCDENGEMILVYDYMSNGTLRDHLYKTKNTLLTWKQRLQICIGSAHGLHYLHTGSKRKIIHRDVKSTNILLDEKFVAKVSDFGLSKVGPSDMSETHVSTAVKGSIGYLDPEYYKLQQLTEKSDVYSFGVVLFEVLCGRPAIIVGLPKEQISLAEWARQSYRKGNLDKIIDQKLKAEIAPECLIKFAEVAYSCVKDRGSDRPSMNDIVWNLEFALQLQESADKRGQDDKDEIRIGSYDSINLNEDANTTEDNDNLFSGSIDRVSKSESSSSGVTSNGSSKFKSESVFSEMMNPTAR